MGVLPVSATGASPIAKRRSRHQLALDLENRRGTQIALIANQSVSTRLEFSPKRRLEFSAMTEKKDATEFQRLLSRKHQ